jgi:hypothetical protein
MPLNNVPADASPASPSLTLPQLSPAHISCSRGLPDWLGANQVSLAFTSYQTGRLYLVGVDEAHRLAVHEVGTGRAMGLWADTQRLVLATPFQVWRFENILSPDQTMNGADRCYVPRVAHTTGEIDIHDVSVLGDGRILFVNTLYSCLALLSPVHAFRLFLAGLELHLLRLWDQYLRWIPSQPCLRLLVLSPQKPTCASS